ncbi:MAG: GeoRSP system radical SAM/SPASM protein [Deltaproteobacteria bacterium]|nr:MAG: GeoRSP system radical SAM/SPASM protein [Deltaproteobacteria bacterium]
MVKLSAPLTVNWTLSYACNFSCRHCYSRDIEKEELALEENLKVVDALSQARIAFVNFGGGEPLLYRHLFEVTEHATKKGLKVTMNSNGWLIDEEAASNCAKAGFRSVGISIDGADAPTHDGFRDRPGSYDRAHLALKNLCAAGVPTTVSTVIFKGNVTRYKEIVSQAADSGAGTVYLHNFKCSGRGMENREELDLSPSEWRDFYEDALAWRDDAPCALAFDDPVIALLGEESAAAVKGSTCGKLSLHLEPDGDATPCGFIPLSLGNILTDGLKKIWNDSDVLNQMRNKEATGKCVGCSVYGECLGGCTARALATTGSFNAPDPHCWKE